MGMATVEVRVCGSAGRDKTQLEQKLTSTTTMNAASFPSKGTDESDSEGEEGHADSVSDFLTLSELLLPNSLLL